MANAICLLYDMCRLCLDAPGTHNVYNQRLIHDIFMCTGILQVSPNDKLPPKICKNCIYKMEASKDLRHYATKNDLYMRSILSNNNRLERHEIARPKVSVRLEEELVSSSTGIEIPSNTEKRKQNNTDDDPITQKVPSPKKTVVSKKPECPKKINPRISVRSLADINSNRSLSAVVSSSKNDKTRPKKKKSKHRSVENKSEDSQEHKCDVCKKTYSTPKKLYLHKRSHTKNLYCPLDNCSKKFATKGDLQKHTRSHTGEKPYQCDLCDKRFTQNVSLKAHKVAIHEQET